MTTTSIVDPNRHPLPACNVVEEDANRRFYVQDPEAYKNAKKDLDSSRTVTLVAITVFLLTLCIFSLNLNAAGWTAGNILTFAVVVGILYVLTLYTKRWIHSNTTVSQMIQNGNPCLQQEGASNIVYCQAHR